MTTKFIFLLFFYIFNSIKNTLLHIRIKNILNFTLSLLLSKIILIKNRRLRDIITFFKPILSSFLHQLQILLRFKTNFFKIKFQIFQSFSIFFKNFYNFCPRSQPLQFFDFLRNQKKFSQLLQKSIVIILDFFLKKSLN